MKPFDIEAAKRGEPILYASMNREGFAVVHFVGQAEDGTPVIQWGKRIFAESESELRMAPKKRTVYVNIYTSKAGESNAWHHDSEEIARSRASTTGRTALAIAVPVEIEE
jgi:hypothetical protein